jgi:hypothetical protein
MAGTADDGSGDDHLADQIDQRLQRRQIAGAGIGDLPVVI